MERQISEKIHSFASLNFHISGVGQPTLTNFGTVVKPFRVHFRAKAKRDKSNHFRGIDDEVHDNCAKNWHTRRIRRPLAPKLWPRSPIFILFFSKGDIPLKLCKILDNPVQPIFCKRCITNIMLV